MLKWGHWVGLDERKLDLGGVPLSAARRQNRLSRTLRRRSACLPRCSLASIVSPPWLFLLFNVLDGITWAAVFGVGGFLLGHSFGRALGLLGRLTFAAAAIAMVYLWRYYKRKHPVRLSITHKFPSDHGA